MIERCGDRQRKCDGLDKWPFHLFVESLPIMLQTSLLLLACGLCRYTWSINTTVAYVLVALTALGTLFYFAIVIAGTSSYECPFQTPASTRLRSLWKEIRSHETLITRPIAAIRPLWKNAARPIVVAILSFKRAVAEAILDSNRQVRVTFGPHLHPIHLSPVISLEEIREDSHVSPQPGLPSPLIDSSSHGINSPTHDVDHSHHGSSSSMGTVEPWLMPEDLTTIKKVNAKDVGCVSWILRNITDPEALDAAIRFAGTVRWFEDGIDVEPTYSVIVSTFHTCFDSTRTVYPGLSERAYYSARAMLWIHIRALCVSREFANRFPLPYAKKEMPGHPELSFLLTLFDLTHFSWLLPHASQVAKSDNHAHMQWTLYALLHKVWAEERCDGFFNWIQTQEIKDVPWDTIPLDVTLNLFLVCSTSLGLPLEGEALKIQDKRYAVPKLCFTQFAHTTTSSFYLAEVISQLSRAIVAAIPTSPPLLRSILAELTRWDNRPDDLRLAAHKWCSVISKHYGKLNRGEELIFHCLEISFRGLDLKYHWPHMQFTYTKHFPHVADIVSNSGGNETIADLLQAWIVHSHSDTSSELLKPWATYLTRLGHVAPTSQRLRQLAIHSIVFLNPHLHSDLFAPAEVEGFVMLLDHLDIGINDLPDMGQKCELLIPLIEVVQSPQGRQSLSYSYWELIPELAFSLVENGYLGNMLFMYILQFPRRRSPGPTNFELQVAISLEEDQEWDKLECWIAFMWFILHPTTDLIPWYLERATLLLLQRPGAAKKLEQRLQRLTVHAPECLECLRLVCERAGLEAALRQDAA